MPVIFNDEQNISARTTQPFRERRGMIGLLIRLGLCKTERGANTILLIVFACIVLVIVLFLNANSHPTHPPGFQKVRLK
jgi:hypothetical protein